MQPSGLSALHVFALCLPFLTMSLAMIQKQHFTKFTAGQGWNNAKEICANNGGHLATVDSYSTSYLRRAFAEKPLLNNDNTWIGLHDAEPEYGSLGAKGFVWATCFPMSPTAWTNWALDEPVARYSNWCVRMTQGELDWQTDQCPSMAHFLCQQDLGPCDVFSNTASGCDTASLSHTYVAQTWDECVTKCTAYRNGNDSCWMFVYHTDASQCSLAVGAEPVYCADSGSSSTTVSKYWVRQCYSLTYNTTTTFNTVANWDAFPDDNCEAMTTVVTTGDGTTTPAEETTTSVLSDTTTLVSTSSASTDILSASLQTDTTAAENSTSSAIADTAIRSPMTSTSPSRPVNLTHLGVSQNLSHTTEAVGDATATAAQNTDMAASAGVPDKDVTTGVPVKAATTGVPNKDVTTGVPDKAATTGVPEKDVTTGVPDKAAITGISDEDVTTGVPDKAATTGVSDKDVTTGVSDKVATTGASNKDPTIGVSDQVATTGASNKDATTGVSDQVATTGASNKDVTTGVLDKVATAGVPNKVATTEATGKLTTATSHTTASVTGAPDTITGEVTSVGGAGITNQTTVKSDHLYCGCVCLSATPPPSVDPAEVTQQIVQALLVDKRHLSSTRRKLTCAIDNRPTAKATGTLGVVLLVGFAGLVILPDLRAIYMHVRHGVYPEN